MRELRIRVRLPWWAAIFVFACWLRNFIWQVDAQEAAAFLVQYTKFEFV